MPRSRFVVALLLLVGLGAPVLAQEADIRWRFQKGETFYQQMTTETKQDMTVSGTKVSQTQKQIFFFSWTPVEEKDKNWIIKQKIIGLKMEIQIGGEPITYDSTKYTTGTNPLSDFFKNLVGAEFILTIDKDMKVTKVEGRDEFLKKLSGSNPQMDPLLKQILSDDALKQMADPTFAIVPGKPVKKGDTWERTNKLNLGPIGTYDTTFKYTYDGPDPKDKNLAVIKVGNSLKYVPPGGGGTGLPFKILSADLKSKDGIGTAQFDIQKGRLVSLNLGLKLEGKLTIDISGMNSDVQLNQEQTTQVKTTDKNPIGGVAPAPVRLAVTPIPPANVSDRAKELAGIFRKKYPLNFQTIGLSKPNDGKRVLIISEPPPHVTLKDLEELDPQVFKQAWLRQHRIGSGGFVTDVVAELPVERYRAERLNEFLARLGRLLYYTSYKLPVVDLDKFDRRADQKVELDLHVSAAELHDWLLRDKDPLPLYPLGGQRPITASQIFKAAPKTSFIATTAVAQQVGAEGERSKAPSKRGLVLWWVPTGKELDVWRVEARQFTIEADLLLGALTDKQKGVLFVGRARRVTFDQLPPLRVEMLLMLSKVKEGSLAQSFERFHPLAYGLSDGNDWAPAYLSKELVDTEFGCLLNVTDQLLKRWSNNGEIDYKDFTYKDPKPWGFDEPLVVTLVLRRNAKRLTFNWNTKGVGYTVQGESPGVFALTRTGSLPVSYIPESILTDDRAEGAAAEIFPYEEKGHAFFAGQSDPNLVRVAQYTGFYQVFHQLAFHRFRSSPPPQFDYPETIKRDLIDSYLAEIGRADTPDLKKSLDQFFDSQITYIRSKKLPEAQERSQVAWESILKSMAEKVAEEAKSELDSATTQQMAFARNFLSNPRETGRTPDFKETKLPNAVTPVVRAVALAHAFPDEWTRRAEEQAKRAGAWVHTPVIVLSHPKGELSQGKGGHNIDAAITRVRVEVDPSLGKDQIKFERQGGVLILKVSDRDRPVPNEVIRLLGRGMTDQDRLDSAFREGTKEVRPPEIALVDDDDDGNKPPPPDAARGFKGDGAPRGWWEHFFGVPPADVQEYSRQRPQGDGVTIHVRRDETTGIVTLWKVDPVNPAVARHFSAASVLDAADAITASLKTDLVYASLEAQGAERRPSLNLIFEGGFKREEAAGLARMCRTRVGETPDRRVEARLRAEWYKGPEDATRLARALGTPVDLKTIRITDPKPVESVSGSLVTSFEVSGHVTIGAKPMEATATVGVQSREAANQGKFKTFVKAVVDRVHEWTGTLKGEQKLQDVLHGLHDELKAMERKGMEKEGDVSLKLEDVQVEATKFGIVLHFRISVEGHRAG